MPVPYKGESIDKFLRRAASTQKAAAEAKEIVDAEKQIARAEARAKASTPEAIAEARANQKE